ncbi:uncharacterized protein [Centruroides vittatus]|uniref:uncharacterized protein LOC111629926 n=1 Tax=Centruroides sculpturatus TaxID=218467 RepID=UPI000C6D5993|nr:uncharacterized protein LOC111629926 [Centruroides sculpturatus]
MGWKPTPWVLLFVCLATVPGMLDEVPSCRVSEFTCANGRCISLSKYCDGTDDCGEGSDEVEGCTSCNRTYYGEIDIKYPLRITEKFPRSQPYVCKITFLADGDEFGDIIQLTFLNFQLGTLEVDKDQSSVCQKGYLQIIEPSEMSNDRLRSQQQRGFYRLMSALKQPPEQLSKLYDVGQGEPHFGHVCGDIVGRSATYFSEGNNVSLVIVVPRKTVVQPFSFSLYLTYKYLPSRPSSTRYGTGGSPYYLGTKVVNTYCDRILVNCHQKRCLVRSPNFPGFYLRNITCHYWIRQDSIPRGQHAHITLAQNNEYKISIYTGRSTSKSFPDSSTLTVDCYSDVVRIYDGSNVSSPLLTEFCGAGVLPEITSSSTELLVELYSAPSQLLHNSWLELEISVRFVDSSEFRVRKGCDFVIDGSKREHGLIYTPRHTVPRNTTCTYHLIGATPFHRVWLYFLSYFIENKHQWTHSETCDVNRLDVYDLDKNRTLDEPTYRFCGKSTPRVCARAADHPDNIPVRPCTYPSDSYISTGSEMIVKQNFFATTELTSKTSAFVARYEFVDTSQDGSQVNNTLCDRKFERWSGQRGTFSSPRNVFFYGRGGRENISCSYYFMGLGSERIRITFVKVKLRSSLCDNYYDDVVQRYKCRMWSEDTSSRLLVSEQWGYVFSLLGCLCSTLYDRQLPVVMESVSNNVKITFSINQMTPYEDFKDFNFEAQYEFLPSSYCDEGLHRKSWSSEGEMVFQTPTNLDVKQPLRCRWLVEASPHKYLYLKFNGHDGTTKCPSGNRVIVYAGNDVQPLVVVCIHNEARMKEIDVFSSSWYNESNSYTTAHLRDHVFVEVIATTPTIFTIRWIEVTKPFLKTQSGQTLRNVNCLFECPELNACISPDLWCDGTAHCPSGYDEAPNHCQHFPTLYVAGGAAGAVILLLVVLALVTHRCRQRGKFKQSRPVPTDDLPMESHHV